jgi:RHS repeat-associated protein
MPSCIMYNNNKQKFLRYFLNGELRSIVYPNETRVEFVRDAQGRKNRSYCYLPNAQKPLEREYVYEGAYLKTIIDTPGYRYQLQRDSAYRIVQIAIYAGDSLTGSVRVEHDALDRVTQLFVENTFSTHTFYEFLKDQTILRTIKTDTRGSKHESLERFDVQGHELYRKDGSTEYFFDTVGRLKRVEKEGKIVVDKEYKMLEEYSGFAPSERLFEEVSFYPDQGKKVEIRTSSGFLVERTWYDKALLPVLRETMEIFDERGSTCLRRVSGKDEQKTIWRIGESGHIEEIMDANATSIVFAYDHDKIISKKIGTAPKVCFEYAQGRLFRMFSDDGQLDYRYVYDEFGRIIEAVDAISKNHVVRKFDAYGRLLEDGEIGYSCKVEYAADGSFYKIILRDDAVVSYSDKAVHKVGVRSWRQPLKRPLKVATPVEYTFDSLGQLIGERGIKAFSYSFSPFGKVQSSVPTIETKQGDCIGLEDRKFEYDSFLRLSGCQLGEQHESYRYDGFGRLAEIRNGDEVLHILHFQEIDLGSVCNGKMQECKIVDPISHEILYLEYDDQLYIPQVDEKGSIVSLTHEKLRIAPDYYSYNAFGELYSQGRMKVRYGFCGKRLLPLSLCYDFGPRRYHPTLKRWLESDPLGIVDTVDPRIFCRNNPVLFSDMDGLFPAIFDFSKTPKSAVSTFETMLSSAYKSITFAKNRLDWLLELRAYYEDIFFSLLGRRWLCLMGYNLDPTSVKIEGSKSPSEKVRITLINGILNGALEAQRNAQIVSHLHGDTPVYYVYSATQGFAGDILRAASYKSGYVSPQAKLLIGVWRSLIDDMGGVDGGGFIWHYAHSLGATDTLNALKKMTSREKEMIKVVTFGSPTIIDADACAQVDNYISLHDVVPMLDHVKYALAFRHDFAHVHFLPSKTAPLMDHFISGDTYRDVLVLLGNQFQDEFLRN